MDVRVTNDDLAQLIATGQIRRNDVRILLVDETGKVVRPVSEITEADVLTLPAEATNAPECDDQKT